MSGTPVGILYGDLLTATITTFPLYYRFTNNKYYASAVNVYNPIVFTLASITPTTKPNFSPVYVGDMFIIESTSFPDSQLRRLTLTRTDGNCFLWILPNQLPSNSFTYWSIAASNDTPISTSVIYGNRYNLTIGPNNSYYLAVPPELACTAPGSNVGISSNQGISTLVTFYDQNGGIPKFNTVLRCCKADQTLGSSYCGRYWGPTSTGDCDTPMTNYCGNCANVKSTDPSCGCLTSCISNAAICFDGNCVNTDAYRTYAMRTNTTPCSQLCQVVINSNNSDVDLNTAIFCNACGASSPTICGTNTNTWFEKYFWIILIGIFVFIVLTIIIIYFFLRVVK